MEHWTMKRKKLIIVLFIIGLTGSLIIGSVRSIVNSPKIQGVLSASQSFIKAMKDYNQSSQEVLMTNVPTSKSGLDYYPQGGIVVNDIAYFTGNWKDRRQGAFYRKSRFFPYVVSFDAHTFQKLQTYAFEDTYDSSPLLIYKRDGTSLIIAHEYLRKRTKALNAQTGNTEWISRENQPGAIFFGFSYYKQPNGIIMILVSSQNGLHALSAETGEELWYLRKQSTGGVTPCVDQTNGIVYYQHDGELLKIEASTGKILKRTNVKWPNRSISWNTILIKDSYGYYIATYWYGEPEWDSAIRVFDRDLNVVWERESLPTGKKHTLTYAEGKLVIGTGNGWSEKYFGDQWKYITAYSIQNGEIIWKSDLRKFGFRSIPNVPYFNGYFYAESQGNPGFTSKLFRIRAEDGALESMLDYQRPISSCAPSIIAHGKMFSGDGWEDKIVITRLAINSQTDWKGAFGDPQNNQYAVPFEEGVEIVPMEEIISKRE